MANLKRAGFAGSIGLVNPHYSAIDEVRAVRSYGELPNIPDLAVIAVPPKALPAVVAEVGAKGTPAAIIITAGLGHGSGSLAEKAEQAARVNGMRLIGR